MRPGPELRSPRDRRRPAPRPAARSAVSCCWHPAFPFSAAAPPPAPPTAPSSAATRPPRSSCPPAAPPRRSARTWPARQPWWSPTCRTPPPPRVFDTADTADGARLAAQQGARRRRPHALRPAPRRPDPGGARRGRQAAGGQLLQRRPADRPGRVRDGPHPGAVGRHRLQLRPRPGRQARRGRRAHRPARHRVRRRRARARRRRRPHAHRDAAARRGAPAPPPPSATPAAASSRTRSSCPTAAMRSSASPRRCRAPGSQLMGGVQWGVLDLAGTERAERLVVRRAAAAAVRAVPRHLRGPLRRERRRRDRPRPRRGDDRGAPRGRRRARPRRARPARRASPACSAPSASSPDGRCQRDLAVLSIENGEIVTLAEVTGT